HELAQGALEFQAAEVLAHLHPVEARLLEQGRNRVGVLDRIGKLGDVLIGAVADDEGDALFGKGRAGRQGQRKQPPNGGDSHESPPQHRKSLADAARARTVSRPKRSRSSVRNGPYRAAPEGESSPIPSTTETTGSLPRRQSTDGAVSYTGSRKILDRAAIAASDAASSFRHGKRNGFSH